MSGNIVLFGATGYTGGLVLDALLRRGVAPTVAGRNPDALRALAQPRGLISEIADVTDPSSIRRLVRRGDVLISTVGPFERYGEPAAATATEAGAHYIDSTGEIGFIRALQERHHARAQETGSVLLPAFAYDYVPGVLAGFLAASRGGDAVRALDIGYFATGSLRRGTSQGTRTTMRDGLTRPSARWRSRSLVDERTASSARTFTVNGQKKKAVLVSGTEVLFLPSAFPHLDDVAVYNGWFPALSHVAPATSAITGAAMRSRLGRRVVDLATRPMIGPPGGPDADERARTRTHVVAVASDAPGGIALDEVHLEGPSVYALTAELLAWGAHQLATLDNLTPGVTGPAEAFGLQALRDGCAEIGLVPV